MKEFAKLFGNKRLKTPVSFDWIPLKKIDQLEAIASQKEKTSVIFKHSTRCGISRAVIKEFESKNSPFEKKVDFYYLDLLNYRPISNEIAEKFGVVHQSPQLLVIKNGQVLASDAHHDLVQIPLEKYL